MIRYESKLTEVRNPRCYVTAGCWNIADIDGDLEERNPNKGVYGVP